VIDPPDGGIPYTPEGRARWEETPHLTTERITGHTLRADTWEDRALQERCITSDTGVLCERVLQQLHADRAGARHYPLSASRACTTRA
jgi:hypothetical protein